MPYFILIFCNTKNFFSITLLLHNYVKIMSYSYTKVAQSQVIQLSNNYIVAQRLHKC